MNKQTKKYLTIKMKKWMPETLLLHQVWSPKVCKINRSNLKENQVKKIIIFCYYRDYYIFVDTHKILIRRKNEDLRAV